MNSSSCTKGAISPAPLWVAVCAHACICRWGGGVWHTVHGDRVPRFLPCRHLRQEAATHSRNVVQVTRETMHGATQSSSLRSRRCVCWQIPEPSAGRDGYLGHKSRPTADLKMKNEEFSMHSYRCVRMDFCESEGTSGIILVCRLLTN